MSQRKDLSTSQIEATTKWIEETRKDMVEVGINPTNIWSKDVFQIKVDKFKRLWENQSKRP